MTKNKKKFISICLSVLMAVGTMLTCGSVAFAVEPVPQSITYTDDFSGYTTSTAPINTTSLTTLGAFKASANNNKTIASGKGLDFIALSGGNGRAYSVLDIANSSLLSVTGSDQGASNTGVRLTNGSFTDLTNVKVSFTAHSSAAPGSGFRLFHDTSSGKSFVFYVIPVYSANDATHKTWKSNAELSGLVSGTHAYVAQEYDGKFEIIALKSYTVDKNGKTETFEWDVAISNGTVSWTLSRSSTSESDWKGSFTEGASFVRANKDDTEAVTSTIQSLSKSDYTYPVSLIGNSDAQGIYQDNLALSKSYPTKFNSVSLTGSIEKDADPILKDEVTSYVENNAEEATGLRDLGAGSTIATHTDGFKWTVPAVTGANSSVYMDTDSNEINILSYYTMSQPINLEPIDGQIKGINKINAVIDAGAEAFGIRFFVNEAEDTYYVLNMNGHDAYYDSTLGYKRMPSFAVVSSGSTTIINQVTACSSDTSTAVWGNSDQMNYAGYQLQNGVRRTRYEFDVEIEGTTINYSIKEYIISTGALLRTFSGTYEADESIINNAKYAVAPYSRGNKLDNNARIKSVKLWADYMIYTDDYSDDAEVKNVLKIMPYEYKNTRYITAVGATYGGDYSTFSDAEIGVINKSDAPNGVAKWSFPKSDEYRQKMFLIDGALSNATPLEKAAALDELEYIITDVTNLGDPQIMLYDGTYYMYSTSGASTGFRVRTSDDLINWSEPVQCLTEGNGVTWGDSNFWAPEVVYHDGKFIMHYSASKTGNTFKVCVATSDSPFGPFVDVDPSKPMFDYGYAAIDASVLITDDKNYLYYSKDAATNKIDDIPTSQTYCVEIDDTLTKVIGEPALMITPTYDYETISGREMGTNWNEGPTVIKYNDKYIMNYSANYFKTNKYAICMAVADDPMGPWVKPESNPVLTNNGEVFGAGHNAFFTGKDGKLYTSFHVQTDSVNPGSNRRLAVGLVEFEEDEDGNITQQIVGCTSVDISDITKSRYVDTFKTRLATWEGANSGETTAFIGDSFMTTSFWKDFGTTYAGKDVSLIGIAGSFSSDWVPCVDELFGDIAPKNVVIHLGTNDFYGVGASASKVALNIKKICTTIHKLYPDTKIYYFAITQRVDEETTYPERVDTANAAIKSWCSTTDYATFVDTTITTDMLKSDGIHMTSEGYDVFVDALEKAGCEIE